MVHTSDSVLEPFVRRLTARSALTEDEVDAVLGLKGQPVELTAHCDFVRLGERVDHSCLVVDGLVGRFGQNSDGERQITCFYIPGDMADLPSVVCPKSAWGLASLTKTTILRVPHTEIRRIAAEHSGIAEALWRECVVDGSIFSQWVVNAGRRDALARLAHLLCEMAIRCEQAGLGDRKSFSLPITQADLADATGLTNVHISRMLKELRNRRVAKMRNGIVTVENWDQLVAIGEFDDVFLVLDGPTLSFLRPPDDSNSVSASSTVR